MSKFNTTQPWWQSRDGTRCKILAISEIDGSICFDRSKEGMRIASKDGTRYGSDHDYDLITHLPDCTSWDWDPIEPGEGWRLLGDGERNGGETVKRIMNVVARTWMDAREHESIPRIGHIEKGWRLVSKQPRQVKEFPKWWLVDLEYERIKVSWRVIDLATPEPSHEK